MSYQALLHLVYQVLLVLGGLVVASLSMRYRLIAGQWFGGFVSAVAAIWAAWTGIDQVYLVAQPFAEKWLGLVQVLATVICASVVFAVIIYITGRPERKEQSL